MATLCLEGEAKSSRGWTLQTLNQPLQTSEMYWDSWAVKILVDDCCRKWDASARVFSITRKVVEIYPRVFRLLGLCRPNQTVRTLQHEGLIFQDSIRLVSSWSREKPCKFSTKIAPGLSDTPYYQPMLLGEGPGRLTKMTEGKPLAEEKMLRQVSERKKSTSAACSCPVWTLPTLIPGLTVVCSML